MTKPLVVVESPAKVRTIKKYLGNDYNVAATVGHIKDLPQREMGIDVEDGFAPKYTVIPGKQKVIQALKQAAADAEEVYLAPDPDREGEAIAWHTADVLKKKGRRFYRVLFHELTKDAIRQAMTRPQELDRNKFEAQQARRILDRLVGYQVSPLLWRKVKGGLSAGRVQSVALRIICERERAIQIFVPQEYWSITAHLEADSPPPFAAKLVKKGKDKLAIPDETAAQHILSVLQGEAFRVEKVQKTHRQKEPGPAVHDEQAPAGVHPQTALHRQEDDDACPAALRGHRPGARGAGRTDHLHAHRFHAHRGDGRGRGAGAHRRAVRPRLRPGPPARVQELQAGPGRARGHPADLGLRTRPSWWRPISAATSWPSTSSIWQRFVASQMQEALVDQVSASIAAGPYVFTASGSAVKFPGFMALYRAEEDDGDGNGDKAREQLPELKEGQRLTLHRLEPKQHFTQPPPRFSEASLVKELEENGIGRPSTYAAILSTIRDKGYVDWVKGYFRPSELGFIVNDLLVMSFPDIFDVEFTARMEENLDQVEAEKANSLDLLTRFYTPFRKDLDTAAEGMVSIKGVGVATELKCPECGHTLHVKIGKNGHFLACSGYPECKYSRDYTRDEKGNIQPVEPPADEPTDKICEKCGRPMVLKRGPYGDFFACSGYPECRNTQSRTLNGNGKSTGVKCPQDGCTGELLEKTSKRGKTFYGCNRYPDCTFATWDKPVARDCPACGAKILVERVTKRQGTLHSCLNPDCGFKEQVE